MTIPDRYNLEWLKTHIDPDDLAKENQAVMNDPDVTEVSIDLETGVVKATKRRWDSNRRRKKNAQQKVEDGGE